jgi:hypothetical protein
VNREIIYAPLVGRRLQKIERDAKGNLYFHFTPGCVEVTVEERNYAEYRPTTVFTPHPLKQEPLVIPAK